MLDDVERRRFLEQPAREDPPELPVGAAHVQLDECAGILLDLPGGGRLAGAQPHHDIADPHRLARPQRQIPLQAIALVEQPEHGDALRHWRRARREPGDRLGNVDRLVLDLGLALPVGVVRAAGRAAGDGKHRRQAGHEKGAPHRDQSGDQA